MIASYHGMVYGSSRQAFALGRAGYLPLILGEVHAQRRTPVPALLGSSLITTGFVLANLWFSEAIAVAVLVSTLAALVWYILAVVCLFVLRRREPELFKGYRAPVARVLPTAVVVLSLLAAWVYSGINVDVIPLTLVLYALGIGYFVVWGRRRIQQAAPEELAARQIQADAGAERRTGVTARPWGETITAGVLLMVLAALVWVVLVSYWPETFALASTAVEVVALLGLLTAALVLVSVVALLHTR
jgi:amino acid transporter